MNVALLQQLAAQSQISHSPPENWQQKLQDLLSCEVRLDEPLRRYSWMKVGGNADALVAPDHIEELQKILKFASENHLHWMVLGFGSNVLIKDGGIRGIVIRLHKLFQQFDILEEDDTTCYVKVGAAYPLPKLVDWAKEKGCQNIEVLYGIPATLGGALWMNAGTRAGEIEQFVESITVLRAEGGFKDYPKEKLDFSYRHLKFPGKGLITACQLKFVKTDPEKVKEKVQGYQLKRQSTQPLDQPSLGSIFKNPPQAFAAQMIDEIGLKGVRVGGARISEKHANFIVNENNASAKDVLTLISLMKDKVKEHFDERLELEIKVVGEDV
ncbi:MAG: UDP-N-acetylmuramate dehydrogenase [Deltaproteobacteria bacterium]|nr:UDP-N-acetylmuramate dehydrogenase [Deltaproteobacteria bacterium]